MFVIHRSLAASVFSSGIKEVGEAGIKEVGEEEEMVTVSTTNAV